MRKVLLLIGCAMLGVVSLSALPQEPQSAVAALSKEASNGDQKKLETKADLLEFIATLEGAYRLGDKSKGYLIGGVYAQEHKLKDGIIPADIPLALQYFKEALNNGYGLSAWYITLLDYIPNKEPYKALDILEKGLNAKYCDSASKATISLTFGTIVLENLKDNERMVRKARDLIYPFAINSNLASVDYVLANLLNLNNEPEEANKFLNSACNNPQAPAEIKNACMGGSEIETKDEKTGQIIKKEESECGKK